MYVNIVSMSHLSMCIVYLESGDTLKCNGYSSSMEFGINRLLPQPHPSPPPKITFHHISRLFFMIADSHMTDYLELAKPLKYRHMTFVVPLYQQDVSMSVNSLTSGSFSLGFSSAKGL